MSDTFTMVFTSGPPLVFLLFVAAVAVVGAYRAAQRRSPEFLAMRDAREALDALADRQVAAGIHDETPEYYRLNDAFWVAAKACPWYLRAGV